jgi:3-dehydroquinate dehydratase/shikimate dehydrogenase
MKKGMLGLGKICAVVAAPDAVAMRKLLLRALREASTAELRLDWLGDDGEILRFLGWLKSHRPRATLMATCRRTEAGGQYRGTISRQLVILAQAVSAGCAWYDLEIETASQCPAELLDALLGEARQLTSAHFFDRMPANLRKVAAGLRQHGSDAIKIAAHCDSLRESAEFLRFARTQRNVVAVPMGDVALPTRILALREKNATMYAPAEEATAPGQVSLDEMTSVYRAGSLNRKTRVFGVIGNPVGHSLSPVMQNAAFQARRMNAVYVPFLVRDLRDFLAAIKPLGISGFSITIPHKEGILKYLDDCDPLAEAIGAVNTVAVRKGELYGSNTDYVGVLSTLGHRLDLSKSRVLILGAGGAARAVAFALAHAGTGVCICSRRTKPAEQLAKAVRGAALRRAGLLRQRFDAIVNATPVGMYPQVNDSPLEARELNCRLVFDTIYRPRQTKLLQLAASRGIETVSGVEMFVAQGAAQWELWTGRRAPVEAMRRAVVAALEKEEHPSRVLGAKESSKAISRRGATKIRHTIGHLTH